MNRRHFLATALAAPLAAKAVPAAEPVTSPMVEMMAKGAWSHEDSNLVSWSITAIHNITKEKRRISGTNPDDYGVACEAMAMRCPFPDWSRCIRTTRAYPPLEPVWTPISP